MLTLYYERVNYSAPSELEVFHLVYTLTIFCFTYLLKLVYSSITYTFLSVASSVTTHARQLTKIVMMWIPIWINNSHLNKLKWQKINIIFQLLFRSSSISTTNHRISSSHLSFQCKTNSSL